MAATLVHIKSRLLLPPDPTLPEEQAKDDPQAELTRQLLEYQRLEAGGREPSGDRQRPQLDLDARREDSRRSSRGRSSWLSSCSTSSPLSKLLDRLGEDAKLQLKRDDVSVADKIAWLTDDPAGAGLGRSSRADRGAAEPDGADRLVPRGPRDGAAPDHRPVPARLAG